MLQDLNKIFFTPGDVVTIKHNVDNKPTMLVKGKVSKTIKDDDDEAGRHFLGIKCFWFTSEHLYQEQIFSTKDLVHVD